MQCPLTCSLSKRCVLRKTKGRVLPIHKSHHVLDSTLVSTKYDNVHLRRVDIPEDICGGETFLVGVGNGILQFEYPDVDSKQGDSTPRTMLFNLSSSQHITYGNCEKLNLPQAINVKFIYHDDIMKMERWLRRISENEGTFTILDGDHVNWNISKDSFERLSEALAKNTVIQEVRFSNIIWEGTGFRSLAHALTVSQSVKSVTFSKLILDSNDVELLAKSIAGNKTITRLNLCDCNLKAKAVAKITDALKGNQTLQELDLSHNPIQNLGAKFLAMNLMENTAVRKLNLSFAKISDDGAANVAQMARFHDALLSLNLSGNSIGTKGAQQLAKALMMNPTFHVLDLKECRMDSTQVTCICEALSCTTTFSGLELDGNIVGDEACEAIGRSLRSQSSGLKFLSLSAGQITSIGVTSIANGLALNASLERLGLAGNVIGDEGAANLASALLHNASLKELDMRWCHVHEKGAKYMVELLKKNDTIQRLNLDGNPLENDQISEFVIECPSIDGEKRVVWDVHI